MKRIFSTAAAMFISIAAAIAQVNLPFDNRDELVSIYEYGLPLTSCETNFKNLFRNWNPKHISNAVGLRLLSWAYVDSIDTPELVRQYFDSVMQPERMMCDVAVPIGGNIGAFMRAFSENDSLSNELMFGGLSASLSGRNSRIAAWQRNSPNEYRLVPKRLECHLLLLSRRQMVDGSVNRPLRTGKAAKRQH